MSWEILAVVPLLSILVLAHELGHFVVAMRTGITVQEFGIGLPPRLVGVSYKGIIYSLNAIPFGAFVKMLGEEDPQEPGSFASKGRLVRAAVLMAGPGMNFLLGALAFALAFMMGWPTPDLSVVEIGGVVAGSPAEQAGVRPGDIVLQVDGQPVHRLDEFQARIRENLGRQLTVKLQRGDDTVEVAVVPRVNPPEGQGALGIMLRAALRPVAYPLPGSLLLGLETAGRAVVATLAAPAMVLQGRISPDVARPVGLPGMAQIASGAVDYTAETGVWFPVLYVLGTFSAGLAVANMLPLPALDGGRLLFVLIEAVRGRRVDPEREGKFHFVGLVVLLTLMLLVSYYDIVDPLPAVDWSFR